MRCCARLLLALLPAAPLAAAPEIPIYREDFEGWPEQQPLAHWTTSEGQWLVGREGANGVLRQTQTDLEGNAFAAMSWADYTMTAALQCVAHGSTWGMGLIAHWQDKANHYRLIYYDDQQLLSLLKVHDGEISRLAMAPALLVEQGWYVFTLQTVREGEGVTLRGKVWAQEAEEPAEWMLTASDPREGFTHGPAGFWTGNAAANFDNFKMVMPQAPGTGAAAGLVEDFEQDALGKLPLGWQAVTGDWKVARAATQTLQQTEPTDNIDFNGNTYVIDQGWANYTVQARVQATESHGDWGVGIIGYWQDANHNYRLRTVADTLFLARRSEDGKTDHLQAVALELQPQTWYVFKLRLENGPRATKLYGKVWREDEREPGDWLLTAEDSSPFRYTSGAVGFWTLRAVASFDNLVVAPNR